MAIKTYFANNETYGASDVNDVINALATGGVIGTLTNSSITTPAAFNALADTVVTDGVINYDGFKVSVLEPNVLRINAGSAIIKDGCMAQMENSTDIGWDGSDGYVYLRLNGTGIAELIFSSTTLSNALLLATITDESVTDSRKFASPKACMVCNHLWQKFDIPIPYSTEAGTTYEIGANKIPTKLFYNAVPTGYNNDIWYSDNGLNPLALTNEFQSVTLYHYSTGDRKASFKYDATNKKIIIKKDNKYGENVGLRVYVLM